jgi:Ser/Thr protein kinase RdoA (MazF antagonist)
MPEAEYIRLSEEILAAVAHIQGNLPCYLDLRTQPAWRAAMDETLSNLTRLQQAGKLQQVTAQLLQIIRHWAQDVQVLEALGEDPGLVHTDLGGDNIFVSGKEVFVIDWQRPIYAPRALDRVRLLESAEIKPWYYVTTGTLRMQRLLSIHWLAQAASRWFRPGLATYDCQIARLADQVEEGK